MTQYMPQFIAFCAGVSALASIVAAVIYTIKRELGPLVVRVELLEKTRNEDVRIRIEFEQQVLAKLDIIKDSIHGIREQYVSRDDFDKEQAGCPARQKVMNALVGSNH